jgi:GPI mannosyltransferase 3
VYAVCCLLRLLNTSVIRSYFDPDEFWQTLEPAYCLAFGNEGSAERDASYLNCAGFTWEWKRRYHNSTTTASDLVVNSTNNTEASLPSRLFASYVEPSLWGPVRSHLPILPTYLLYRLVRYVEWDTSWAVSRGPMLLHAVLVAAPVDTAVGYAASLLYESNLADWCLLASLLSWFNGYSLVRTFSNSQETALLSVALALVAPELLLSSSSSSFRGTKSRNHRRRRRAFVAFYLGGLSTAIRFTALAAFVPMGLLLANQFASSQQQQSPAQKHTSRLRRIRSFASYLLWPCAAFGVAGIATSVVLDRVMYGFWTVPFLGLIHFNVVLNYASLYGSHPWHWYFSAGLPAVAGLLLVPLLGMLLFKPGVVVGSQSPAGVRNLWCILISYVAIMSFNGHKEFRYIHPVLPLVCLLTGPALRGWAAGRESAAASTTPRRNQLRKVLVVALFGFANLVPVLYLGLFHQSGPVSVNRKILEVAREAATASSSASASPQTARFTVYYWTGECHSTPLHSHLHQPRHPHIEFDTWSLDCSPTCRADLHNPIACETKRFQHDPVQFANDALCRTEAEKNETYLTDISGSTKCRPVPDFVVTFSSYVQALDPVLRGQLGMRIIGRYPFHLRGAALSSRKGESDPSHCWELGNGDMCKYIGKRDIDAAVVNARTDNRGRRQVLRDAMGWTLDVESDDVVLYSLIVRPARPLGASGAALKDDEAAASVPALSNGEL